MTLYRVYETEALAVEGEAEVFTGYRGARGAQGYETDSTGVYGKVNGVTNYDHGKTTAWDTPIPVADDEWPDAHGFLAPDQEAGAKGSALKGLRRVALQADPPYKLIADPEVKPV